MPAPAQLFQGQRQAGSGGARRLHQISDRVWNRGSTFRGSRCEMSRRTDRATAGQRQRGGCLRPYCLSDPWRAAPNEKLRSTANTPPMIKLSRTRPSAVPRAAPAATPGIEARFIDIRYSQPFLSHYQNAAIRSAPRVYFASTIPITSANCGDRAFAASLMCPLPPKDSVAYCRNAIERYGNGQPGCRLHTMNMEVGFCRVT